MPTAHLHELLRDLDPARLHCGSRDAELVASARRDLRAGALAALRAEGDRHLTVSCLLVAGGDRTPFVALGLHAKSGEWRQLGGHLEADDASLRSAAIRELLEESGIRAVHAETPTGVGAGAVLLPAPISVREFHVGTRDCAMHLDVLFAARMPERRALCADDDGIARIEWWPATALPPGTAPDLRRDLPDLLSRIEDGSSPSVLSSHPRAGRN